jgi:hypothetical protein
MQLRCRVLAVSAESDRKRKFIAQRTSLRQKPLPKMMMMRLVLMCRELRSPR